MTDNAKPPVVDLMAALEESLAKARIKFWDCPQYGKDAQHPRSPTRVRIEWDGDVATCLDCGRDNQTSAGGMRDG